MASTAIQQRIMPSDHPWDWSIPVPFSQGWRIGDTVYIGGQISADRNGGATCVGDIEGQTRNVFESIGRVLRDAGARWGDLVKLNTFYVYDGPDEGALEFWEKMTRVRMEYLEHPGPVGTAVCVPRLGAKDLLIEVEAVAVIQD